MSMSLRDPRLRRNRFLQGEPIAPPGDPIDLPGGSPEQTNAFEQLKSILRDWGLLGMANELWDLVKQATPFSAILNFIYTHPLFAQRFAGIFDERGRFRMTPAEFVQYEKDLHQSLATFGFNPRDFGMTFDQFRTALISSNRSIAEVADDMQMFAALDDDVILRRQFYAYSGIDPGTEGLFAIALGLPEGDELLAEYEKASQRLDPEQVQQRVNDPLPPSQRQQRRFRDPRFRRTRFSQPGTGLPLDPIPTNEDGTPDFSGTLSRIERLQAFRRATLARRALFQAGGGLRAIDTEAFSEAVTF